MSGIRGRSEDSLFTQFSRSALPSSRAASTYNSIDSDEIELVNKHDTNTQRRPRKSYFSSRWNNDGQPSKSWRLLWRRLWSRVLPVILTVSLVILLLFLSLVPTLFFPNAYSACDPDGEFSLSADGYTPWKRSGVFAINIKMGSFGFGQAKALDVSWDILVGRGGQALLAFFAYKVFTKGLTKTMQTTAMPHDTFRAITLQNDTVYGLFMLVRNFPRVSERNAKGTTVWMLWIIVSASFVLLIPTWLSAMTGYVSDLQPYATLSDDSRVPLISAFKPVIYTIEDGARLGEPFADNTFVLASWREPEVDTNSNYYSCGNPTDNRNGTISLRNSSRNTASDFTHCLLLWAVSKYTSEYGFLGLNNTNTTFQLPVTGNTTTRPLSLDKPSLKISASFAVSSKHDRGYYSSLQAGSWSWYAFPYGMFWKSPQTNKYAFQKPLFQNTITRTVHDAEQMKDICKCQQTRRVRYQWGFSFLLLYTFIVCLMLWMIGMWSFYFSAVMNSHLNDRDMGVERAAFDLARSMQQRLDMKDSELFSDSELRKTTKHDMITYKDFAFDPQAPTRWTNFKQDYALKKWVLAEKWWAMALVGVTIFWVISWFVPVLSNSRVVPVFGWIPGLGVFLVLVVGRETHGRWTLAVFFLGLFAMFVTLAYLGYLG